MKVKRKLKRKKENWIGAKEISYYGIKFKSKLELYTYKKLKEYSIKFEYEKESFILLNKFDFINKSMELFKKKKDKVFDWQNISIRAITYTPDFTNLKSGWIIECKGHPNDAFPIKWKLFKYYLTINNMNIDLFMPRNQKQVNIVVEYIKNNYK